MGFPVDDDDEDLAQAYATEAQRQPEPVSQPEPQQQQQPLPIDIIKASLAKKFGQVADNSQVNQARDDQNWANKVATIGQALEGVARAQGQVYGGQGVNTGLYQSIRDNAAQGVAGAQNERQQAIQNYLEQRKMGREDTADQQTAGRFGQDTQLRQAEIGQTLPDSKPSQVGRAAFKANFPDVAAAMGEDFNNLSYADLGKISQFTDVKAKIDAGKEAAAANRQAKSAAALAHEDAAQARLEGMKDRADQKVNDKQQQAYTELNNTIQKPRGNANVQQAQVKLTSVATAKDLISQYPNLDAMPPDKVTLLNAEIAKIATGGAPSDHSQAALAQNTVGEKFARFMQKVGNKPSGAQLGLFIQQNKEYLDGVEKTNKKVVSDFGKQIYNGYKNRLSDDQKAQFKLENADLFPEENQPLVMADPNGKKYIVTPDKVKKAQENGWQLAPQDKTAGN